MKGSRAVVWLLLLGAAGLGARTFLRGTLLSPAEEFSLLESRIESGIYDHEQSLQALDQALVKARENLDADLASRILLARGRTRRCSSGGVRARADLLAVLEARGGDRSIEELLIDLEGRAGDFAAGLARVHALVEAEPGWAGAWRNSAKLHRMAAEKRLEEARRAARIALVPEEAVRAGVTAGRSASLDPDDPRRVALAHELRSRFGYAHEEEAELALRAIDLASEDFADAREAYAKSLALEHDAEAFGALLELLDRSGRTEDAIDLATAALRSDELRADLATAGFLIRALDELGREALAASLAREWVDDAKRSASPAFWLECVDVIYASRNYGLTIPAAQRLQSVANAAENEVAEFYIGLALIGQQNWEFGRFMLEKFLLSSDVPEPFPGARAHAWREMARAAHALGSPEREREGLEAAIELEPSRSGDDWLRVAELQLASPHSSYRQPELRFAIGMSMLPRRTTELLPRWRQIGELSLRASGIDLETIRASLAQGKPVLTSPDPGPYELYSFADVHRQAGELHRAAEFAELLLRKVPGFVPGLDLSVDIAIAQGRQSVAVERLIERIEAVGLDERGRTMLRQVPTERISPRALVTVIAADPERTGRLIVARELARTGQVQAALATLDRIGIEALGDEGRLLAAELWLELREPRRALEVLEPVEANLAKVDPALSTFVDVAVVAGELERVDQVVARIASSTEVPDRAAWLALADRLASAGSTRAAEALLRKLDTRPKMRGGDLLVRLASAALSRGDVEACDAALERALAFDTRGGQELVALCAAIADGRTEEVAPAALELGASGLNLAPVASTALDALAGRRDAAGATIDQQITRAPDRPLWQLLAGAHRLGVADGEHEVSASFGGDGTAELERFVAHVGPERLLGWLVAVSTPYGAGWVQSQLVALDPAKAGVLWPGLLGAQIARSYKDPARERALLDAVLAEHPDVRPAWDQLEALIGDSSRALAERSAVRLRRNQALGEAAGSSAERWLDQALAHQLAGEATEALRCARRAVEEDPENPRAHARLAELAERGGDFAVALESWRKACLAAPSSSSHVWTPRYLHAIDEGLRSSPPLWTRARCDEELEALRARHPDDPRVVVAQARLDLGTDELKPVFLVSRAYARLERFLEAHPDDTVEGLAPGSLAEWVDFHLALDPSRALSFVERERDRAPGTLAPWILIGRVRAANGDYARALDDLAVVQRLAPTGATLREYVRIRLRSAWQPEGVEALASQIQRIEAREAPDAELVRLIARAHFQLGTHGAQRACEVLEPAWAQENKEPSATLAIGRDYALALLARGRPEDVALARQVLDAIEPLAEGDPYLRDVLRAARTLALDADAQAAATQPPEKTSAVLRPSRD